jgi:hypothetical protein
MAQLTLTQEQKEKFLQGISDKGLSTENIPKSVKSNSAVNYLTDEPGKISLIPVQKFSVHHLDKLKEIAGNSNQDYVNGTLKPHHHEDLPAWDEKKDHHKPEALSVEDNNNIVKAFKTYVYGDSEKVKSYQNVIHNHHFPLTLANYAAENLTVQSGHVLKVDGTMSTADWGTVTIENGGSIEFETHATWTAQSMDSQ